jgi:hypothetical protein
MKTKRGPAGVVVGGCFAITPKDTLAILGANHQAGFFNARENQYSSSPSIQIFRDLILSE